MTFLLILAAVMAWPLRAWGDEILIGLIPEENIFNQMERHRPLAAYLSKKVGTTAGNHRRAFRDHTGRAAGGQGCGRGLGRQRGLPG